MRRLSGSIVVTLLVFTVCNGSAVEAKDPPEQPIDLNGASLAELKQLPGIGDVLANRIIEHRPYRTVEELDKVERLGADTIRAIRPFVFIGQPDAGQAGAGPIGAHGAGHGQVAGVAGGAANGNNSPTAERDAVAEELSEFRRKIDATSTAQLKQISAEETIKFQRWREQHGLTDGCKLMKRGPRTSAQREADLVGKCKDWKSRIALVEKAIKDREKNATR